MMHTCVCHLNEKNARNAELSQNVEDLFPEKTTNNNDKIERRKKQNKTKDPLPFTHTSYISS